EAIVPAATFVATASAVVQVGGVPIFVDVDPRNYTIDPKAVEAAVTPQTRAVVAVDLGGMPCDMDALNELGRRRGIAIVSDCAHSHGSRWKGVGVGALGDIGAFSFQMLKTLPTGEGGMVLTNRRDLADKAYSYHSHGRVPGRPFYEHHAPATNLRMTEWQAAIGLAQLSRLEEQTRTREENATYLMRGLETIDGVAPIWRDPRVTRWGFFFLFFKFLPGQWDGVNCWQFRRALSAEGVPCGIGHTLPLYRNPVYARMNFGRTGHPIKCPLYGKDIDYSKMTCPETERIYATEACALTHRMFLGPRGDMDRILDAIRKLRARQDELRKVNPEPYAEQ
ncbi:MAG: DegT/DnrJ/EryC1/StrS family aminotransferase, partial [Candidatus Sumerlaeota bacterium]|nr:DegT/DnrJ/EryC1/StrS family aminotransferase [Candidatus Sumerlaeota bacterium]